MQERKTGRLGERTVDIRRPSAEVSQQPAASDQRPVKMGSTFVFHWLLACWLLAAKALRAKRAFPADFVHKLKLVQKELKESRVWLLFASRLSPGPAVEALRTESRELLLMIGKSINTATARIRSETLGV